MVPLAAWTKLTTTETIDTNDPASFLPPQPVMTSAATPKNATAPMEFNWIPPDDTTKFYVYMYFTEIQKLQPNESRVFNILLNGNPWTDGQLSLPYLQGLVYYSTKPITGGIYDFALVRTPNSTHPPLLNAIEIYRVIDFPQSPTEQQDGEPPPNLVVFHVYLGCINKGFEMFQLRAFWISRRFMVLEETGKGILVRLESLFGKV